MFDNRLGRRHPLVQIFLDNWFYFALAILLWRLPHLLGDYFGQEIEPRRPQGNQPVFWMGIFIQLFIFIILAMSYNLIFGFGGILTFGHALYFGMGTYILLILMVDFAVSLESAFIVALSVSAIFGLLTSIAIFRIKGVYFAMFTLALAQVFFELSRVNLFKTFTEGDDGRTISGALIPDWINPISSRLTFYYVSAFAMVAVFFLIRRLMHSPTGKVILAIRDNEERAKTMGYNTALYKAVVVTLAGMLATLAGFLHALFNRGTDPTNLGLARTVDPLFTAIIGGIGTHPGPVVGGVILHLGEHFFRKPDLKVDLDFLLFHIRGTVDTVEIWRLILGAVFIIIVLVAPMGVVGQLNRLWLQIRGWIRRYIYNPLVRANPGLAERMEPFTGESPAIAQAFATKTQDASVIQWAIAYPWAAVYSLAFIVGGVYGLIRWEQQAFFSVILFTALVSALPLAGVVAWRYVQARREVISPSTAPAAETPSAKS